MDEPTKALTDAQEKTVKDLNLYLYCKNATAKTSISIRRDRRILPAN